MLKLLLLFIALLIIWAIKIAKEPTKEQQDYWERIEKNMNLIGNMLHFHVQQEVTIYI